MQSNTTRTAQKLLDQVRDRVRFKHFTLGTENTYLSWIRQFILYHGKRHPAKMGSAKVVLFFTYPASHDHDLHPCAE